jgi:hypothetical protein
LVAVFSGAMMTMTGHMLHMDSSAFAWTMTINGFLIGLVLWTALAAVAGWLIGWIYNASERSNPAS